MEKVSIRRQIRAILGGAVLGAAVGVTAIALGRDALPAIGAGVGPLGALLLAAILYMLCIGVHEAGHVAAGLIVGYRPLLFIVGPLRIERSDGRLRAGLNRSFALAGGLAVCAPAGTHDLRRRTLVMAAGGPIASLLLGVQCLAVWLATSPLLGQRGTAAAIASLTLMFLGIGSLGIGIITLVPMRTGGFYSDGARILRLMRSTDESEREVALIALTGLTLGGIRPREWDAALVRQVTGIRDGGAFEVGALQFAHAHALDNGDIDAARDYLEAALTRVDQLPPSSRGSLHLSAAIFHALHDGDAARARASLDRAAPRGSLLSTPHQRLLAMAAVLLAEGDSRGAIAAAEAARKALPGAVDRGSAILDDTLVEQILGAAAAAA